MQREQSWEPRGTYHGPQKWRERELTGFLSTSACVSCLWSCELPPLGSITATKLLKKKKFNWLNFQDILGFIHLSCNLIPWGIKNCTCLTNLAFTRTETQHSKPTYPFCQSQNLPESSQKACRYCKRSTLENKSPSRRNLYSLINVLPAFCRSSYLEMQTSGR